METSFCHLSPRKRKISLLSSSLSHLLLRSRLRMEKILWCQVLINLPMINLPKRKLSHNQIRETQQMMRPQRLLNKLVNKRNSER